jgi:hypothetical protein
MIAIGLTPFFVRFTFCTIVMVRRWAVLTNAIGNFTSLFHALPTLHELTAFSLRAIAQWLAGTNLFNSSGFSHKKI